MLGADLARSAGAFLAADQRIGDAVTADTLHDARVALRRIRSQLRTFRTVFEPDWLSAARAKIGWYEALLGEVRDVDVAAERLLGPVEQSGEARGLAALTALLATDRAAALRALAAGRDSRRYTEALHHLRELAAAPPMRRRATRGARAALPTMLERPWHDLRESAGAARQAPSDEALHHVRIRAKELRYASELAAPVLGDPAARLARACAGVQRELGDYRDAVSATAWLRGAAARAPECAFLAGRLAVGQQQRAAELAAGWPGRFRQAKRAWRRLRRDATR